MESTEFTEVPSTLSEKMVGQLLSQKLDQIIVFNNFEDLLVGDFKKNNHQVFIFCCLDYWPDHLAG